MISIDEIHIKSLKELSNRNLLAEKVDMIHTPSI
jgi:hypothetical protein